MAESREARLFPRLWGSSKPAPPRGQHGNRLRWPLTGLLVRDLRSASLGQGDAKVSSSRQTLRQKLGSLWTLETSEHRARCHSQEGQRPSQLCHWVESAYCPEPHFPSVKWRQGACLQLGGCMPSLCSECPQLPCSRFPEAASPGQRPVRLEQPPASEVSTGIVHPSSSWQGRALLQCCHPSPACAHRARRWGLFFLPRAPCCASWPLGDASVAALSSYGQDILQVAERTGRGTVCLLGSLWGGEVYWPRLP